ncbi:hypothetical protein HJP15_17725 [Pseudoalteromonas sp. NEC-BIFX-2020_002]|uniref:hypothetical protein n=1 Tax=Pseudoalteromonas TaxID=53246 RepID=UPI0007DB6688|nr:MULTISPECIES: hypothetical protein [Pseudoalteromonas]NNG44736.1 hypothetical protein [Pseudoalteromonas sp. NEC-BIFX-2020_002]
MRGKTVTALAITATLTLLLGSNPANAKKNNTEKLYDFDEKVHYHQTKLDDNNYQLTIQSDDYPHFKNQSVFLLRHANRLCRGNTFMLKVTGGVQEYEQMPTKPRAYQPPLTVLLQCETEPNKD